MQYARLIICFVLVRLAATSTELHIQDGSERVLQNRRRHEEFRHNYSTRLITRGVTEESPSLQSPVPSSSSSSPPLSAASAPQSHPPVLLQGTSAVRTPQSGIDYDTRQESSVPIKSLQSRAGTPEATRGRSATSSYDSPYRAGSLGPSREAGSPSIWTSNSRREGWDAGVGPSRLPPARDTDSRLGSPQRQPQRQTGSLPIGKSQSSAGSSQLSRQRASLPTELPTSIPRQPASSSSKKVKAYMSAKGSIIEKADKGSQAVPTISRTVSEASSKGVLRSPQSSIFSWASLSTNPSKDKSQKLPSASSSYAARRLHEFLTADGKMKKALLSLKPGQNQLDSLKKAVLRLSNTKKGASSSKSTETSKAPSGSTLDHKALTLEGSKTALYRSNSDPLIRPLTPARAAWMKRNRMPNRPRRNPESLTTSSDIQSTPISPPSLSSLEMVRTGGAKTATSSRSSIATSAFAQMAQGPPIVGAGLSKTTLHNAPSEIEPLHTVREATAGGSYEILDRNGATAYNAGTASGPQSLGSKIAGKMKMLRDFSNDRPADLTRAIGSAFGHVVMGVSPGIAATGNVAAASVFGATGAALSYISGNERLIPQIEKWQRSKKTDTSSRHVGQ